MSTVSLADSPASPLNADPTVFVVDDDEEARSSISRMVRSVGLRAESFATGFDFLKNFSSDQPGCLVLDTRMPGMTGLELQSTLAQRGIRIPVIIVSESGEIPIVTRAMRAGAIDFLLKPCSSDILLERINEALKKDAKWREEEQQRAKYEELMARLTLREREVLGHFVEGCTTRQVAAQLGISSKTVDNHRAKIFDKLNINNMVKLARLVTRHAS
jgi:RNA polymerase sigma factor (sigma-70 family)